jgi:precorrin-6B methylase 2
MTRVLLYALLLGYSLALLFPVEVSRRTLAVIAFIATAGVLSKSKELLQHVQWVLFAKRENLLRHWLEFVLRINTKLPRRNKYLVKDSGKGGDAVFYEPTFYSELQLIRRQIAVTPTDILLDMGCGKGRFLFFFAYFCQVQAGIGVDIDPELIAIAQRNLETFTGNRSVLSFVREDMYNYVFSQETIIYMFNPFGRKTRERVMQNLKQSLIAYPRKITLISVTPVAMTLFENGQDWLGQDWLELKQVISKQFCRTIHIWHNVKYTTSA